MQDQREQTLRQLGMPSLGELKDAEDTSHLISTCISLQFKPLKDFRIEDLRIMLGQDIGTEYLLPIAIEKLYQNIMCEGDLSPGDLLRNVLALPLSVWQNHPKLAKEFAKALKKGKQRIAQHSIDRKFQRAIDEITPILHSIANAKP